MSLLAAVEEVEEEETTPLCARITATLIASKLSSSRKRETRGVQSDSNEIVLLFEGGISLSGGRSVGL